MKSIWPTLLFCLASLHGSGQVSGSVSANISLPAVALLDIEPNSTGFNLDMTAPTEAGTTITTTGTNATKWLNFTSAVTSGATRRVSIRFSGTMPNGVNLVLTTASYTGTGAGSLGTRISPLTLTSTDQTLINSIGGAFTGNGVNNGYNLSYTLQLTNFALLRSQNSTLTVIYTLVDN